MTYRALVVAVCPDCYESDTDHCGNCWCCDGSMDEFTTEGVPIEIAAGDVDD